MVASSVRRALAGSKPRPSLQQIMLLSKRDSAQRFKYLYRDQRQNKSVRRQVEHSTTEISSAQYQVQPLAHPFG
jgi:hypothetical protein